MRPLGQYLRWLCLLGLIAHKTYFIIHGSTLVKSKEGEMAGIFICDNSNDPAMAQCTGYDDVTTCDENSQCIRSSCGRPLFPHIGISYAGSSDPFDSDSSTSTQSFITIVSLLYSLMPYLLITYFSIHFLLMGDVVSLSRLGMMGFVSLVNDLTLKNIVKQSRPTGSCLYFHSYGMPSGHAATSIGLTTYMLLELLMYHPNLYGKNNASMPERGDVEGVEEDPLSDAGSFFVWGYGWRKRISERERNSLEAIILSRGDAQELYRDRCTSLLSSSSSISEANWLPFETADSDPTSCNSTPFQILGCYLRSKWLHHYHALLWAALLLPVPLSRVHLHDHYPKQILFGSIVGAVLGNIWYFCVIRSLMPRLVSLKNSKISRQGP